MKSIKSKGMLFSLCVILMVVLVLGISDYLRFKHILTKEVNNAVERIAKESSDHLSSYINQLMAPLINISSDERIISMEWEKQKNVIESQLFSNYQAVAVVNSDGIAHFLDDTVIDLRDRDYIMEALSGRTAISDILISIITNQPAVIMAVPIYRKEKVTGALIARLDVNFLSDFAFTRGYGNYGRAYIISDQGTFISRPEHEKIDDKFNLFTLADEDELYRSFADFVRTSMSRQSGYGSYSFDNQKILMGYSSVPETNWKIYIGTYESEALSSLNELNKVLFMVILITLVVGTLAAWIFVDRFVGPIVEMDHLFSLGARGDLTIRFTPKSKDEIGRLGNSFNRMMDNIKSLTQYDPLTSLLNQYVLEKDITSCYNTDSGKFFSLIMIAIDKFSQVNETYGYTVGDLVLCEISKRILSCCDENYRVYRYKGDEFVVFSNEALTDIELDERAQCILALLKDRYDITGKTISVNISIGTILWSENIREEDPLQAVTQAKNYAKYLGGNQIQKYNHETYQKLMIMNELQADIIAGLKEDQFFLVYQPLFDLKTEKIAEIESLIRWQHPEKGLLYPDQFIELAEQAGTIIDIDYWVLEKACKLLKNWKRSHNRLIPLAINISTKTFETKKFIPDLTEMIHTYQIDPSYIQLEITERMAFRNVEEGIYKLNELRSLGFRIAIDDFGIGYSSLNYIVRLPIDSIKIDKSFVQSINSSDEAKAIVSTIISLCKTLSLNVIAEGIESRFELDYLVSNQCEIGQGYYFSRPVMIREIEQYL